ncbi:hypothetical protein O0L34_g9099 [Tuta absoluta]|nr:hypothetical protein O0L34_g9099 [Tuta absoluta]
MMVPDAKQEKSLSQVKALAHAYTCDLLRCTPSCNVLKRLISHYDLCKKKSIGIHDCRECQVLTAMSTYHAKILCTENKDCPVYLCDSIKHDMRKEHMQKEGGNWKRSRQEEHSRYPSPAEEQNSKMQFQPLRVQFNYEMEGVAKFVEFEIPTKFVINDQGKPLIVNPMSGTNNHRQPIVINLGNFVVNPTAAANRGEQVLVNGKPLEVVVDPEHQEINKPGANDNLEPAENNQRPPNAQPIPNRGNPGKQEINPMPGPSNQLEYMIVNSQATANGCNPVNQTINTRSMTNNQHHPVVENLQLEIKLGISGNRILILKPLPGSSDLYQSKVVNAQPSANVGSPGNQMSNRMSCTSNQHQPLGVNTKPAAKLGTPENRVTNPMFVANGQRKHMLGRSALAGKVVNLGNRVINAIPVANNHLQPVAKNRRQAVDVNSGDKWNQINNQLSSNPMLVNQQPLVNLMPVVNHHAAVPQYPPHMLCPYQPLIPPHAAAMTVDWRDNVTKKMRKRKYY